MAVDRGGLQYTIRIEDKFSGPLGKFTAEIRAAQKALNGLGAGATALKATAKAIRAVAAASRAAAKAVKEEKKEETIRERIRRIAAEREKKARLEQSIAQRRAAIATREEVQQARRLLTARQKQVAADKAVTRIVNERTKAQERLNAARARGVRLSLEEKRRLGVITDSERTLLRLQKQRAALDAFASSARLRNLTAENEAKRRAISADKELATQEILRAQGRTKTGAKAPLVEKITRAERARTVVLKKLRTALKNTGQEANRVSFTFRRLFGILAAFAAARAIFRAFAQLTKEIVRFNAAIEQAELGIASLFLAVGDVRDLFGRSVTAAQGLEIAIAESRKQMDLLRRDALKTAGTFENLLDAFQVAVAPGLQAGLDIDEIRKFTVDISRAATAIGLQQNQLAEEIRSILSGTIQARTTRIAVALGITNEDIRNAKEAGVLIDFLNDRFSAFGEAGEKALETFNALFTNLKGAIQLVLASGGEEFFTSIKDILGELFELITSQDPITKILSPDPRAVAIVKNFANGLKDAIGVANSLRKALTFEDIATAAKGIGTALLVTATILSGIIKGMVQGFNLLVNLANKMASAIKGVSGDIINTDNLRDAVALITTFATVSIGISLVSGVITALWGATLVAIGAIGFGLKAIALTLKVIRGIALGIAAIAAFVGAPVTIVVAAIVGIITLLVLGLSLLKHWLEEVTGLEFSFINFLRLLGRIAIGRIKQIAATAVAIFKGAFALIKLFAFRAVVKITDQIVEKLTRILDIIGKFNKAAKALSDQIKGVGADVNAAAAGMVNQAATELAEAGKAFIKAKDDFIKQGAQDVLDLAEGGKDADVVGDLLAGAKQALADLFDSVIPDLTGLFGNIDLGLASAADEVRTLGDAFDDVKGIIADSRKGLDKQATLLKKLKDEAVKAAEALRIGLGTIGLSNSALAIRTAIIKTQNRLKKESQFLDKEEAETRKGLTDTELGLLHVRQRINSARNAAEQEFLDRNRENFKKIADAEKFLFDAVGRRNRAEIKLLATRKRGTADEIRQAELLVSVRTRDVVRAERTRDDIRSHSALLNTLSILTNDLQEELITLIKEEAVLLGQEIIDTERLAAIAADRILLENQLQLSLARRITLLAEVSRKESEIREQRTRIALIKIEAARQERLDINNAETRVRNARAELITLFKLNEIAQAARKLNFDDKAEAVVQQIVKLNELRAELLASRGTPAEENLDIQFKAQVEAVNAAIRERKQIRAENGIATEEERQKVLALLEALDAESMALTQPIEFGFTEGLRAFLLEANDVFTTFKGIVTNAFNSLGDTLASTLTNALAGVDQNIRLVFANLLKDLATQIIQMLIRLAIAKAAAGIFGVALAEGGEVGRAKGGSIPAPRAGRAQGLAAGGAAGTPNPIPNISIPRMARPRGLDSRDTVPIWAQKGEWMMRLRAVRYYGTDLMNAINSMLINPSALRAIAGIGSSAGAIRRVSQGAAAGGEIGRAAEAVEQTQPQGAQGIGVSLVVGSEDSMQQILNGGRTAMLDFLRTERNEYMGAERVGQ